MLRPLALPVLHRMDWRVRGAVDRSGTGSAVLRLEGNVQAISRMAGLLGMEAAQRHQELQSQNQALQDQNQALQGQNREMLARLGAVEREMLARLELVAREQKQLGAQVGALQSNRSTADLLEDLRSDLAIRLDAFSLSLLRAKVFSVELAALEARLHASLQSGFARNSQLRDDLEAVSGALGSRVDAVAQQAGGIIQRTDAITQQMASLLQWTGAAAQQTAELAQRADALLQQGGFTLERTDQLLRRNAIQLGRDFAVRTDNGYLLVPAEDERLLVAMVETGGRLEPGTSAVIMDLLPEGGLMVDVGAHIGTLCVPAARRLGRDGQVLALEPTPRTAALLRRSLALHGLDGRVTVLECAAGAEEGRAMLGLSPVLAHNSLAPLDEAVDHVEVAVRPLDAVVAPGRRVDLVKIDAEGFELQVWRGMQRIVAENPRLAVLVEFGPSHIRRAGGTIADWIAELCAPGYTPWEINEADGTLRPLRGHGIEDVFSLNLLLLRDDPRTRAGLRLA